ncbi:hypothetical protein FHG87_022832, partial [Trinorchestia longiramus]
MLCCVLYHCYPHAKKELGQLVLTQEHQLKEGACQLAALQDQLAAARQDLVSSTQRTGRLEQDLQHLQEDSAAAQERAKNAENLVQWLQGELRKAETTAVICRKTPLAAAFLPLAAGSVFLLQQVVCCCLLHQVVCCCLLQQVVCCSCIDLWLLQAIYGSTAAKSSSLINNIKNNINKTNSDGITASIDDFKLRMDAVIPSRLLAGSASTSVPPSNSFMPPSSMSVPPSTSIPASTSSSSTIPPYLGSSIPASTHAKPVPSTAFHPSPALATSTPLVDASTIPPPVRNASTALSSVKKELGQLVLTQEHQLKEGASQLATLQDQLAAARQDLVTSTQRTGRLEQDLQHLQEDSAAAQERAKNAENLVQWLQGELRKAETTAVICRKTPLAAAFLPPAAGSVFLLQQVVCCCLLHQVVCCCLLQQ